MFALSDLQSECNRLYDFGAQQVLDIAQSLYEKHKATTYPRTDCGYLPESQLIEVPQVIESLIKADTSLTPLRSQLNLSQKSRPGMIKKSRLTTVLFPQQDELTSVKWRKMSSKCMI